MTLASSILDVDRVTVRLAGWSAVQSQAAQLEGWDIFECFNSDYGSWQIQALDDGVLDGEDQQAFSIVTSATKPHHRYALAFLERYNPLELEMLEKWIVQRS